MIDDAKGSFLCGPNVIRVGGGLCNARERESNEGNRNHTYWVIPVVTFLTPLA